MTKDVPRLAKIKTSELKVGMYVADLGVGWFKHPWKTKSKLIELTSEIQELVDHGINEVIIDLTKGKGPSQVEDPEFGVSREAVVAAGRITDEEMTARAQAEAARRLPNRFEATERRKKPRPEKPLDNISLDEEFANAVKAYNRAMDVSRELMSDIRAGKPVKVEAVRESVDDLIDSVFRNRDAMVALLKLKSYDEYTFTHSINVAALAVSIGRQVNFDRGQLMNLGLGAHFSRRGQGPDTGRDTQ